MANYKNLKIKHDKKYAQDYDFNVEKYVPNFLDLPSLYDDIQQSFDQKNAIDLEFSLERLRIYISEFEIDCPSQFQDILFPILTNICQIVDNEDMVLYGLQFISFITKNDVYINYIPLFSQPDFFDFCFPFLTNQNQKIIFWALDCIQNFICLHKDARDYSLNQLTISDLAQIFIQNDDFLNEEKDIFDLQVKALMILRCYTNYEIDEESADQIFKICDILLGDEACYQNLYENALWIAFNLIQHNGKYVTEDFLEKIDKFYHSPDQEHLIPALKIAKCLISHNLTPPNSISKNFLSLFLSKYEKVEKLSIECVIQILENQERGALNELILNNFFSDLTKLLSDRSSKMKLKASKMVCIILEECGPDIRKLICHKGLVHTIFLIFELEIDELTVRVLRSLLDIYSREHAGFVLSTPEEEIIFDELIDSPSAEISELANDFIYFFRTTPKNTKIPQKIKRGPKRRVQVKPKPIRNKMRLWIKPKNKNNGNNNNSDDYNGDDTNEYDENSDYNENGGFDDNEQNNNYSESFDDDNPIEESIDNYYREGDIEYDNEDDDYDENPYFVSNFFNYNRNYDDDDY